MTKKSIMVFAFTIFSFGPSIAQVCSFGCVTGTSNGGTIAFATGYAWNQPAGTTCGKRWLAGHPGATVYFADVISYGSGGSFVLDSGTLEFIEDMHC